MLVCGMKSETESEHLQPGYPLDSNRGYALPEVWQLNLNIFWEMRLHQHWILFQQKKLKSFL